MTKAEMFSNVFALIALVLSVINWYREKKSEKRAHEFDLFSDIYKEYMVKRLPEARNRICITRSGKITQVDGLIQELNGLRKASIYFQYAEPDFFENLRKKLWQLEDYLVMLPDPLIGEQRANFDFDVNRMLKDVYQCLLDKF